MRRAAKNDPLSRADRRGVALVIILAFIVLLTGLIVAFFSRAVSDRQVSNSSANRMRVEIMAEGATDIILGDLTQEILAGSITTGTAVSGTNYYTYAPTQPWAAVPCQSGSTSSVAWLPPNVLKRSANGQPFFSGTFYNVSSNNILNSSTTTVTYPASNRAAAVSSTTASVNGRYISMASWNQPLLIPSVSATSSTPMTGGTANGAAWSYAPPDWVFLTRSGANPILTTGATVPAANISGGADPVLGRYAYTIYDEGGLLDMNVAGYPSALSGSSQITYKGSEGFADLTALGLTSAQADQVIGWRNYVSATPTGSFPSYNVSSAASASNYSSYVLSASNTFLSVGNVALSSGQSDRAFTSRQQLINFITTLTGSNTPLQYMGTFTRALQQPSFSPNPNRPSIVGTYAPPGTGSVNTYLGNNTYWGGESAINMTGAGGFLGARAGTAFTRLDGSTAVVGEPLVKRRFALSNLSRITTSAIATQTASDPIYSRFGIYRSSASSPWVYNHGSAIIMTLNQVAALTGANAREADFAELLKAAINVGSVGKAGPSGQGSNDQYTMDVSGDVQILQIMANLIDQQKTDNYPTWIQYTQTFQAATKTRNLYGEQDLPYFYRWSYFGVTSALPSPLLSNADQVTVTSGTSTATLNHTRAGSALTSTGTASLMIIPVIWNPHDANTPVASGTGPTNFRVTVETNFIGGTPTSAWGVTAAPTQGNNQFDGAPGSYSNANPPSTATSTALYMTSSNSYIQFNDGSAGKAFREPTLLWRTGYPSGVSLTGTSRKEDSSLTGNTYYGLFIGDTPVSWTWTDALSGSSYISQASTMQLGPYTPGASGSQTGDMTFRMQYQDPTNSSNWINYQETYVQSDETDYPSYTLFVNKNESAYASTNSYANPYMTAELLL
jgi:hypothetical protein